MYHLENKGLWIRRIVYLVLVGLSLLFISFYGGNVPYIFFFAVVLNSIGMVVYIVYVFFSIKIYQTLTERQVVKNELVPYKVLLNNEGFFACRDVYLDFMETLSEIKGVADIGHINLVPEQGVEYSMELIGKYSGTYFVGVDSVEIMDYFKILKIRFPMPQKMKVTVKPRILHPENLSFITKYEECHDVSQNRSSSDMLDNTVRNYVTGDNKNFIHWKNSAKRQEIMIRTTVSEEIYKYVIVMDHCIESEDFSGIVQSDKLRELTLAMVHYILGLGYQVEVLLGPRYREEITSYQDFEAFYAVLTEFEFVLDGNMTHILHELHEEYEEHVPFLFITAAEFTKNGQDFGEFARGRNIYVLNVNLFDDIEEFLQIEERTR